MESNVEYIIKDEIKFAKYNNLYFINNKYIFITTNPNIKLDAVYTMGGALNSSYEHNFILLPELMLFNNQDEINNYINGINFQFINGVTNALTHYWDHNIAHALYDALYPIYLLLLQFYSEDTDFNIFIDIIHINGWKFSGNASREFSIEIFKKFSKREIIYKNNNYMFNTLLCGCGLAGISGVNKNGFMPGKEINALEKFRNRMYSVYNIQPIINKKPKITIIDSNRYTVNEKNVLINLNQDLNNNGYESNIISWFNINSFKEQLNIMNSTDIHISGAGSSMLNFPFLNNNKVHINLGVNKINPIERFGEKDHCHMPGLLEVNICLLPNSIYVDFYNIYRHKEILFEHLHNMVYTNIYNLENQIYRNTKIPKFINIWKELCIQDPENINNLIERMTYPKNNFPDLIPIRFIDMVICGQKKYNELININILNLLKNNILNEDIL